MSLVARELSLSYETVRRRVADMRAEGRCEGKRGVVRPVAASGHRDRRFFDRLATCAVGASRDAAELGLWRGEPLEDLRDGAREAAVAQIQDHTLSMIKSLRRSHGLSVIDVVLISGVHRINLAREFAERGRLENLRNAPSLATRKPASMFQIAKTLSLPYETVRRRLIGLREKGLVDRDEAQGFVARTRLEENPGVGRGLIANAERTEQLLRALNALCLEPVGLGEPA